MAALTEAAGGVVLVGERVLVLRKRLNHELRLPKGRLDPDESPADAALRETAEETGFVDLRLVRALGSQITEYRSDERWQRRQTSWFQLELVSHARGPRDRRDAQRFAVLWLPVAQALAELTFADEREFLLRALPDGPDPAGETPPDG